MQKQNAKTLCKKMSQIDGGKMSQFQIKVTNWFGSVIDVLFRKKILKIYNDKQNRPQSEFLCSVSCDSAL